MRDRLPVLGVQPDPRIHEKRIELLVGDRTQNRHRCPPGEKEGVWDNSVQGSRQIGPVPSEEGVPDLRGSGRSDQGSSTV